MKRKGTYVLIIDLGSDMTIDVGALGQLFFSKRKFQSARLSDDFSKAYAA